MKSFHPLIQAVLCLASVLPVSQVHAEETELPQVIQEWTWKKVDVVKGAEKSIVGFADPFPSAAVQLRYPYRVVLVIEYDKEGSLRLPSPEEESQFEEYELAVGKAFARDGFGVVVGSLASDGIYQLISYAQDGPMGEVRLLTSLPGRKDGAKGKIEFLQYSSERDPNWAYVTGLQRLLKQ
jgi:hypothetical protein